jgi:hypothetical protein
MIYRLIVSVMLFVLGWTGTFLHDLAEDWCDGQHCETSVISRSSASNVSNASNPCNQKMTLEDIDPDGHIHMVVIASQNHDELLRKANDRVVHFENWVSNSTLSEVDRERPPPLAPTQLTSQKIFLATRRLLI